MELERIKYRAKEKFSGRWVYGFPRKTPLNNWVMYCGERRYCIVPETLGQYSGVDDVNGNPIFEGDIVETFSIHLAYQQVGNYPPPNIEVEEWEVNQSVNEVEFSYGSFNINGFPIMFEDMMCGDDKDDKSEDRQIFESLWEDNCYDLQDEYPYLTWEYFCKPHILGNIFDNPNLLTDENQTGAQHS